MSSVPILYYDLTANPELHDLYLEQVRVRTIKRSEILLKAGDVCTNLYFVEAGLLRCSYRRSDREVSSWFAREGDFCWSADSFLHQTASVEEIEALEDSVVSFLSLASLRWMCSIFPEFEELERVVTARHLIALQKKMRAMWMVQSPERLGWFEQEYPGLRKRVAGKHLASWLGITEVMMSRISHRRSF